ncbi:type II toxin-antitoxin system ParD family antitoxin [Burkholderia cenocepacia]|uniref:type II toxin-antitoxin system ParD family antitoxin n=1 Tax=Burkholderia cenocepacia TaxID=95486 RepID=UPI001E55BC7E|nr:type II toxin-antitoxin system ParD family antitoxin [Burkholderia cenocepacia]
MSRKAPVSQDDHVAEYVDADGLSERCSDSDTMRARLRLLESRNAQVRALQDALDAGGGLRSSQYVRRRNLPGSHAGATRCG